MTNSDINPISDDDRKAAVERLRVAHAAGRLDRSELSANRRIAAQVARQDRTCPPADRRIAASLLTAAAPRPPGATVPKATSPAP